MTPDQTPGAQPGLFPPPMNWVVDQLEDALVAARDIIEGNGQDVPASITDLADLYPVAFGFMEAAVTDLVAFARERLKADAPTTFLCWHCGQVRDVLDRVLDIEDAQVCGFCVT